MLPIPRNTTQDNNSDNPVYIINLSTIHGLAPISTVLDNFATLHYDYAKSWLHFEWYSKLWVSLKYLTMTPLINEYKLGKINTEEFIERLLDIFYFLKNNPQVEDPKQLLKDTWNSLINWDNQSTERLNYLIAKNQFINLISNTNELNIQKIKLEIDTATEKKWDWQKQTEGECQFQVYKNFRLMTSYENGVFKTEGLLEKLVAQLVAEGHIREKIILVSQYQPDLDKAKELGIKNQSASEFFPSIPEVVSLPSSNLLNNEIPVLSAQPAISLLPNNLFNSCSRPIFSQVPEQTECTEKEITEKTPLLKP